MHKIRKCLNKLHSATLPAQMERPRKTFTSVQTAILERLAAFEADATAQWLLISIPRKYGTTNALVEHVAAHTERDVIWITRTPPETLLYLVSAHLPTHPTRISKSSRRQLLLSYADQPDQRIRTLAPAEMHESINDPIVKGLAAIAVRGSDDLLCEMITLPNVNARHCLLLAENVDITQVPTRPEYTGHNHITQSFCNQNAKTVIVFVDTPLPPCRDDCPDTLEWRLSFTRADEPSSTTNTSSSTSIHWMYDGR